MREPRVVIYFSDLQDDELLVIQCSCGNEKTYTTVNAPFPFSLTLGEIKRRSLCTKCGKKGALSVRVRPRTGWVG